MKCKQDRKFIGGGSAEYLENVQRPLAQSRKRVRMPGKINSEREKLSRGRLNE